MSEETKNTQVPEEEAISEKELKRTDAGAH